MNQPGGVNGSQRFGHARAQHPHAVQGEGPVLAEHLRQRRSGDKGGHHPGPFGVRVGIDNLCGVESADLAASLYLETKPPPELGVVSEKWIDQLDRDRAPGPRPAEEHLTHPARPKTADQNIVPDSPRVFWSKGIHATPLTPRESGRSEPARTR